MSDDEINLLLVCGGLLLGIWIINSASTGLQNLVQPLVDLAHGAESAVQGAVDDFVNLWGAGDDFGDGGGPSIGNPTF